MRKSIAIVLFLSVIAVMGSAAAEPNMQEGKWEMTMKTEMKGMPMAIPPMKFTQCLTKKDAVPQKPEKDQECKMVNSKVVGNTVTWTVQCRSKEGSATSTGKVTYSGNRMEGVINMTMKDPQSGTMQMTQHMNGKRIGDCK